MTTTKEFKIAVHTKNFDEANDVRINPSSVGSAYGHYEGVQWTYAADAPGYGVFHLLVEADTVEFVEGELEKDDRVTWYKTTAPVVTTVVRVYGVQGASGGFGMYDVQPEPQYYPGFASASEYVSWAQQQENTNLELLDDDEVEHVNGNLYNQGSGKVVGFRSTDRHADREDDSDLIFYELVDVIEVTDAASAKQAGCIEIGEFGLSNGTTGTMFAMPVDRDTVQAAWDEIDEDDTSLAAIQSVIDVGGVWIPDTK